ncbi:expressed unknown protein [Seminavis robusta]|uniref:Peptidase S54 rhomboid domain-containing protein n=1 Tax=Seminavis robusta TaxID=568900 RepID=A0A9N8DCN8_9STRA|nr:expressed unknown protein [Seminavis robusta]|eukprot:Sro59_g034030.1 n/a (336) ;mRNA; f:15466-16585
MSDPSQPGQAPPPNPVLTAYENFVRDTPLVTRYVLTCLTATFVLDIFIDSFGWSLSNIPYFAIGRLELYRILVAPLVCNNLFSLVFAYFSFIDHGKRLECSMGSAQFAWLFASLGIGINTTHVILTYSLQFLTGDHTWIHIKASGIWTVLFPLIAIECVAAPPHSMRKLFFWQVPTLYYPLILLAFFTLLGGYSVSNLVAVATGYAYGYGYLDKTKVSTAQTKQWEETTILANFARRDGWVGGNAATGQAAWVEMATSGGGTTMAQQQQPFLPSGGDAATSATTNTAESFPSGGGRQLGGPTRRGAGNTDARAARLKVLEANNSGGPTENADDNV